MDNGSGNDFVLSHLKAAISEDKLDQAINLEMLPALAEGLGPIVCQYMQQKGGPLSEGSFPDATILYKMANNFNQDAPRVRALLETCNSDQDSHWQRLHQQLEVAVRRKWPTISLMYQEEIAQRTWLRIHRYLPRFLFLARFSTWVTRILLNEYLRLKPKIEKEKRQRSLDEPYQEGRTLADVLPSAEAKPHQKVEREQALQQFWQRLEQLGQALDCSILRLHLAGYKLEEIKEELGGKPSVSTIWKRRKRLIQRIKEDEVIREIAQALGILPLE